MKKKKLFRFFVFFVILLFLLSIPGMYISYFFLGSKTNSENNNLKHEKLISSGENEKEFFRNLEKKVNSLISGENNSGFNSLSGNILSGNQK